MRLGFNRNTTASALLICSLVVSAGSANASVPKKYQEVAAMYGVNAEVLYAIAMTESKYYLGAGISRPWPWTANVGGKAVFKRNREELSNYLKELLSAGYNRFDVGLMQISWRHHSDKFASVDEAIDPDANLRVGAAYLKSLLNRTGTYEKAVGMYHTGEGGPIERQKKYKSLVWNSLQKIRSGNQ